jgi:hypothetical protein
MFAPCKVGYSGTKTRSPFSILLRSAQRPDIFVRLPRHWRYLSQACHGLPQSGAPVVCGDTDFWDALAVLGILIQRRSSICQR